jgi:hypothetical protein
VSPDALLHSADALGTLWARLERTGFEVLAEGRIA